MKKIETTTIWEQYDHENDLEATDRMLLEEAKKLLPNQEFNALNTVGYKELFKYFSGEWSLDFAILEIKKNTRRFAKRQLTWFKKNESIIWFDYETKINKIINYLNVFPNIE